eukprot:670699-Rhodomonas_salina.3
MRSLGALCSQTSGPHARDSEPRDGSHPTPCAAMVCASAIKPDRVSTTITCHDAALMLVSLKPQASTPSLTFKLKAIPSYCRPDPKGWYA